MSAIKIGIVGIGSISGIYLDNISKVFEEIEVIGVCDLIKERAENAVKSYNIPKLYENMEELFADPEVDIVLNLTRPGQHFNVSMSALKAGKHVYSEKPLGASLEEGTKLTEYAKEHGLLIGGAPDTFLSAGIQTCRKLIEDGYIGTPVGAAGFMLSRGTEAWHPDPEFFYKYGGGPMFDMGPYYLTALVSILGSVAEVCAMTKKSFPKRQITSQPHNGDVIDVDVQTHVAGTMLFESGVIGTLFTTFDVHNNQPPRLEIYGSLGTLHLPDPNCFGGPVLLYRPEHGSTVEMPLLFPYAENSRSVGLTDMARAIKEKRLHRANSGLTYHVLEIMESFLKSGETKSYITIKSRAQKTPILEK